MLDSFRISIQCFIFLSLCIRINAFQAGKFKGLQHTFENEIKSGKKQYAVNRRESSSFSKPSQKNYNGRNNRLQKQRLPQNKSMQHYRAVNSEIIAGRNVKDILEVFVNQGGLRPVNNEDRPPFNAVNYSTAVHRLAKFSSSRKRNGGRQHVQKNAIHTDVRFGLLIVKLAFYWMNNPDEFGNREISNLLWSTAKLNQQIKIQDSIRNQDLNIGKLTTFTMNHIKTVIRNRGTDEKQVTVMAQLVQVILLSIGKELLHRMRKSKDLVVRATPQELSNIIWSLATIGECDEIIETLVDQLVILCEQKTTVFHIDPSTVTNRAHLSKLVKPQEISNTLWSLAKLTSENIHYNLDTRFFHIFREIAGDFENLSQFKPQETGNTIWALATLVQHSQIRQNDYHILREIVYAYMGFIVDRLQQSDYEFKPQEASNIVWGIANLISTIYEKDQLNRRLIFDYVAALIDFIVPRMDKFPPQELNNALWGIAKIYKTMDIEIYDWKNCKEHAEVYKFVMAVQDQVKSRNLRYFKPQDVSTILYSLANLNCNIHEFAAYSILLTLYCQNSKYYKPQETSNIAWAIATAGYVKDGDLERSGDFDSLISDAFACIGKKLYYAPEHFKPQEQKDVLWSLGRCGIVNYSLFHRICKFWVSQSSKQNPFENFESQSLGGIAYSIARQALPSSGVVESHDGSNGKQAVYMSLFRDIFNSDARLMHKCFSALNEASLTRLHEFSSRDLNNLAYSMAILGIADERIIRGIFDELLKNSVANSTSNRVFAGSELSVIIYCLATLNLGPTLENNEIEILTQYLNSAVAGDRSVHFQDFELLNLTWGAVVLGTYPVELLKKLVDVWKHAGPGRWERQQEGALLYIQTLCQIDDNCEFDFPTLVTGTFADEDDTEDGPSHLQSSKFQISVMEVLKKIVPKCVKEDTNIEDEHLVDFMYVDIAIPEYRLCIECDGPSHYCIPLHDEDLMLSEIRKADNDSSSVWSLRCNWINGSTELKDRILKLRGWRVIHVPYWEWNAARRMNRGAAEDYLTNLILSAELTTAN